MSTAPFELFICFVHNIGVINAVIKSNLRQIFSFYEPPRCCHQGICDLSSSDSGRTRTHAVIRASVRVRRHKLTHNETMKNIEGRGACGEDELILVILSSVRAVFVCICVYAVDAIRHTYSLHTFSEITCSLASAINLASASSDE